MSIDSITKETINEFFLETSCYEENKDEEKYDEWASDYRHKCVDDKVSDEAECAGWFVDRLLCEFGITNAFQLYMDNFGMDKVAPSEKALLYCIIYEGVCEKTSHKDYMEWLESRKPRPRRRPIETNEGECPICYEAYGEKPDGSFLPKDGKHNSDYQEACNHYTCIKCCVGLIKDKCKSCDTVKCPLCREDWTEWIFSHYSEDDYDFSDDDEEDE